MATHDQLTGLPNRCLLDDRLAEATCRAFATPRPELPRAGKWPGSAQVDQLMAHLPAQIPTAIAEEQLVVGFQPVVIVDGRARKVEALVRWQHPTLGLLLPAAFAAAVERSPYASALSGEVLLQACRQVAEWRAEGMPDLEVAVTVSRGELLDRRIVDRVRRALDTSGLPAGALWVETTKTTLALDHPQVRRTVERLRALGIHVAADAGAEPTWAPALQAVGA